MTKSSATYTSFEGVKRIASGDLETNVLAVKRVAESRSHGTVLSFHDQTGQLVEIELHGSVEDLRKRLATSTSHLHDAILHDEEKSSEPRSRGRPKLGVVAREVTLLPRHWDWLEAQQGGASAALRRLVDEARRANLNRDALRHSQERAYRFMSAIAGDFAGFEEAARALFANDQTNFARCTDAWPKDVRDYARTLVFGEKA